MGFLMQEDGEPVLFFWIGQATTTRLKARYWLQVSLFNALCFAIFIISLPALLFLIPAAYLAIQAVKKFDSGDEEGCKKFTLYAMILSLVGILVGTILLTLIIIIPYAILS